MVLQERWVVVVILLVITAITRPDLGSFHRFISRAAESQGGILMGLLTRAATLVGHPFGLIRYNDYLLFTTASISGRAFIGIWGTWLPWLDFNTQFKPSEWFLALPRCRKCANGICLGQDICLCSPSYIGASCTESIPGFYPFLPNSAPSVGLLDLILLAQITIHILHLLVPRYHAFHRIAHRHFVVSWQAVANGRLHTLLLSVIYHKSTLHLLSNIVSYLSYAPLVASVIDTLTLPRYRRSQAGSITHLDPRAFLTQEFWVSLPPYLQTQLTTPSSQLFIFFLLASLLSSLGTLLVAAMLSRSRATGYGFSGVVSAMRTLVALTAASGPSRFGVEMIRDHIVWHFIFDLMIFGGSVDLGAHLGGSVAALLYHYAMTAPAGRWFGGMVY